jgi:ABC-type multidrug transport system ATPase subunit/ABC-type multidrug transport system permease subunit
VLKEILKNVWGTAMAGETTAIMGASGAGKTSLFNILAGRTRSRGRITVHAASEHSRITLGGNTIDPNADLKIRTLFAFCAQEEALHEASTPRESLFFSAKLRLPKATTNSAIRELVDAFLEELGLSACADTIIGGGLKKGISGGEKRRTSIGVELISDPNFIFLDEPTSGLDSFAAKQVMKLLDRVAQAGNTVLFTIHQPSSEVFASFDRLILLHVGRLLYQGLTEAVPGDFSKMGFPIPSSYNPADWILDVALENTVEDLEKAGFFPPDERPAEDLSGLNPLVIPPRDHVSLWSELGMLIRREKTSLVRNPAPMTINVCLTAFLSGVFGVIFFQVGAQDRSTFLVLQSQLGALVNVLISTMMGQAQAALMIFSSERPLFLREYSTDHYSVLTYFVSHLASEALQSFVAVIVQSFIVFFMIGYQQTFFQFFVVTYALSMTSTAVSVLLGSMFSDVKLASSMFPLVVVPQFYFSGVFIAINLIPPWVRWSQYLCSLTYASHLSFVYEFGHCDPGMATTNCEAILRQNGVDQANTWWYWVALMSLFVAFRVVAMLLLRQKGINHQ